MNYELLNSYIMELIIIFGILMMAIGGNEKLDNIKNN